LAIERPDLFEALSENLFYRRLGFREARIPEARLPRIIIAGNPLAYAPAQLLQDLAYSYRVWITLIKLLYAPLHDPKIKPDIHASE